MMSKFMHTEKQRAPASSFHQTIVEADALRKAMQSRSAGRDLALKYSQAHIPNKLAV